MMHAAAEQGTAIPSEAKDFSAQEGQLKQLLLETELSSATEDSLALEEQHTDSLMGDDESFVDDEELKATLWLAENFATEEEQFQDVLLEADGSSIDEEHFRELLEAEESATDEEHSENLSLAVEESVQGEELKDASDEAWEASKEEQLNKLIAEDEGLAVEEDDPGEDHLSDADESPVETEQFMHLLEEAEDSFAEQASPVEAEESSGEEHCNDLSLGAKEDEEDKDDDEEEMDDDEIFKELWGEAEVPEEPATEWEQSVKAVESSAKEEECKSLPSRLEENADREEQERQGAIAPAAAAAAAAQQASDGAAAAAAPAAAAQAVREESAGELAGAGRLGGGLGVLRPEVVKAQATPHSWRRKRPLSDVEVGAAAGALGSAEVALPCSREEEEEGSGAAAPTQEAPPHTTSKRRCCPDPADSLGSP